MVRGATPDAERPGHGVPGKSNKAVVIEETLSHLEMKYGELIRIEDTYMIGDTAYDMEGAEMQGIHGVGEPMVTAAGVHWKNTEQKP